MIIKVVLYPVFLKSTNLESKLIDFFNWLANSQLWESSTFNCLYKWELSQFPVVCVYFRQTKIQYVVKYELRNTGRVSPNFEITVQFPKSKSLDFGQH